VTTYAVKETFLTLQGEGARTGRPAVFCRFARCNLWSGREADRASAVCRFCDTDFVGTDGVGGGLFRSAGEFARHLRSLWVERPDASPYVVCTGGEPLLQLDAALVDALHQEGFEIAVETNGTLPVPDGVDWICVSPKAGAPLVLDRGDELKLVFPQAGAEPHRYERLRFSHLFVQPMDGPHRATNTEAAVRLCAGPTPWRLSLQTHKLIGIP
jgi:7-carboxy-7-deazaguanine synthase